MQDILIVDDEAKVRDILARYLTDAGYRSEAAESVAAAKRLLSKRSFGLILSDIGMPDDSGIDLIRHVKATCPDTPMIMVSTIDNPADARQALELGVYGYIVKPFTRDIVLINVENALRHKALERERQAHLTELEVLVEQRTWSLNNKLRFAQQLMEAIPNPVFFKDINGRFQGCNMAFENLTGTSRDTMIGKRMDAILTLPDPDFIRRTDRQLIQRPGKTTYETTIVDRHGTTRHIMFNKATYQGAAENVAGFVGVLVDITERRKAEESLRISESKLRQIAENIGIGVAMVAPDLEILWSNRQMRRWFPDVRIGHRPLCFRCRHDARSDGKPCDDCPTVKALESGKPAEITRMIESDIGQHQFRLFSNPVLGSDGQVVAVMELVEEVTQKVARERDLRQAQKLESIGQLAAGIAHEINSPTQYIGDNTRFVQDTTNDLIDLIASFTDLLNAVNSSAPTGEIVQTVEKKIKTIDLAYLGSEIPLAIEQTLEGVSRVSKIVASMRHFSHPGCDHKTPVDINHALTATITVARNAWKYVAELETDFDADLPKVSCLPGEINQVFLNLLVNAAHAVGETNDNGKNGKGQIRISTRHHHGIVEIRFADNGGGIPAEIRDRIFDPFFTTKTVGKGTGQGLAIAHSVVAEKHAGTIRVESSEGRGTTFVIQLPVNDAADEVNHDEA